MSKDTGKLFLELDEVLSVFLQEVDKKKLADFATEEWMVKDVLGHIVFWHQYYAQQYELLTKGDEPYFHPSLAGKSEEGRKKMKSVSKRQLIHDLQKAHESLRKSIAVGKVPKMRYMASREYATDDFLKVVIGHLQRHTVQVRRAKQR